MILLDSLSLALSHRIDPLKDSKVVMESVSFAISRRIDNATDPRVILSSISFVRNSILAGGNYVILSSLSLEKMPQIIRFVRKKS